MTTMLAFVKSKKFLIPAIITVVLTGAVVGLSVLKNNETKELEATE